ncbi:MAG: hypothetical protein HON90_04470, partial [Halobacteriovoraceae bacterium]|nr:hypothetical protein [Halobacteriovoraceae bacterium]
MIRALSYLCVFSIILAISLKFILVRQFQSDEFLIATSINLLNFPKEFQFIHILNFYMIPFSFFTNLFDNTQSILYFMRISFFGIFLLNIYLLSRFVKLSFLKNLILFIIVLTHYQLWRFGFEIRHETLIVLFIILTSLFIKKYLQTSERKHIFWVGAFLSLLSFTAYKGFIYSIAMGGTFFLIEMIRKNKKSIRPLTFFLASYIIVSLLQMFLFYYFGHLPTFLKIMNNYVNETDTSMLFSPIGIYLDIIKSSPITVLTFIIGVYFFIKKKEFYNFKGWAILNVINITILLHLNPAPFRYNIHTYLIVILIAVLALYDELPKVKKYLYIPLISIHLSLFLYFFISDYYMNYRNDHQLEYVKHAESLTTKDEPVFDLIGLIATRNQIHPHWWLYNAKMKNYYTGKLTYVADMIKQKWPPVIITNYRWP